MEGFPIAVPGGSASGPVLVTNDGNDLVYNSVGQPPGSGAIPNGQSNDVFESVRAATGWVTTDVHPEGAAEGQGNPGLEVLAASSDGSTILVKTIRALSPVDQAAEDFDLYLLKRGQAPVLVSHGRLPRTVPSGSGGAGIMFVTANADLTSIGFTSGLPLDPEVLSAGDNTYVWSSVAVGLNAGLIAPPFDSQNSQINATLDAMTPDGRPVYTETATQTVRVGFNTVNRGNHSFQVSGSTPSGSIFDALSPDGSNVYITTSDHLDPTNTESGPDIYRVDIASQAAGLSPTGPPEPAAVSCISCGFNGGGATYIGQSADGSHVYFTSAEGSLYEHDIAGTQLVAPVADGLSNLVLSNNGQHVIASTSAALSPSDTSGTPDLYELSQGDAWAPRLITSGASIDSYTPAAVSDDGSRVVYNDAPASGPPSLIDESVNGEIHQISPTGSNNSYSVLSTAGSNLRDIFFAAHEPILSSDENAGAADIYDARIDGGFAPCTLGDSSPQRGTVSCTAGTPDSPNPTGPATPAYTGNLAPPEFGLAALPGDTSTPTTATTRSLTTAQKRSKALRACKRKPRNLRASCEKHVKRQYRNPKASKKRRGRS
jgi:hypothetical protein